ncbi:GDSL esterase/lipase At2g31540-like [Brassica rapa]|uniref:GDSL esterase/lipase At2g31540-like n=1 Tax=Brassica campestris TaxID=3711 RepID=UPI00142E486F|nr:GDSL esterase/lipase At2g31540-like [Brassica rapa]
MSTSKTIALTLFLATTLFASCNAAANATTKPLFPAILIFGDSTVDTGNNNYPLNTIFKATHFPYGIDLPDHKANGRFSNGKLIPDILAGKFNIKQFVPPFLQPNLSDQEIVTGVCFASAGSGYDDLTSLSTQAIPVSEQPKMFRNYIARLKSIVGDKKAMEIINNALVVISAGTNDMVLNFYTIPTRRLEFPFWAHLLIISAFYFINGSTDDPDCSSRPDDPIRQLAKFFSILGGPFNPFGG